MPDTDGEPAARAPARFLTLKPLHVDLGDVLVQVVAVALGVVLGFAVTAWSERARQNGLLRATAGNIVAELSSNQAGMAGVSGGHAKSLATYAALLRRADASRSVSYADAKKAILGTTLRTNVPLSVAWQIAQSDQGLSLLDYDDRYRLGWVYQLQSVYYQAEDRYKTSLLTVTEPPNGNYYFLVLDLANQEQSVVATERQLDGLYTKTIADLKKKFQI